MTTTKICLALFVTVVAGSTARAQIGDKKTLTLDGAKRVAAVAAAEANKRGVGVVIAVVDDGGHLLVLERLDNTQVASVDVGIGKARTAAIFRRPTKEFEEGIAKGRTASLVIPGATPLQGGIPISYGGKVIGAIGVSGDTPQADEEIAKVGAAALSNEVASGLPVSTVTHLEASKVAAAFAKGVPLLETRAFKVHASRREAPGQAEIHSHEIDVIYVLDGEANFIVGGDVVDGKHVATDEIRGSSIRGGNTHVLKKGDVFTVPGGVPHQFLQVKAPFLYYVVKVPAEGRQGLGLTPCGDANCSFCRPK